MRDIFRKTNKTLECMNVILLHSNYRLVSAIHVAIFKVVGLFKQCLHLVHARNMEHMKVLITLHKIIKSSNELHGASSSRETNISSASQDVPRSLSLSLDRSIYSIIINDTAFNTASISLHVFDAKTKQTH
jgi:hypothetical protein